MLKDINKKNKDNQINLRIVLDEFIFILTATQYENKNLRNSSNF